MNDSLTGQLTKTWLIPPYARSHLYLDSESGSTLCEGKQGLFELPAPADVLSLRWGSPEGAMLTQLHWQADNLAWDGSIRLGGLVEAIHLTELVDIEAPMAVIYFSGQPLRPPTQAYPTARQRALKRFEVPDYLEGVDDSMMPTIITLITLYESPLVSVAQDSLMNKIPLHVYGQLADEADGWHEHFALPCVWESVTIFAP